METTGRAAGADEPGPAGETVSRTSLYESQPMLRLLDAWVLDAMGVLDPEAGSSLQDMTPRLTRSFGVEAATWQQAVERAMHMPAGMREDVAALWERNLTRFAAVGRTPDPLVFAHGVVDQNLR